MKKQKRLATLVLTVVLVLSMFCVCASAKTNPAGQTVGTVLFYVRNSADEDILVSHVTVAQMEEDMRSGLIDTTNHNYSLLDRYVTTLHQEAQGFTVPEFVSYSQSKSTETALQRLKLTFTGEDKIALWEIDQTGFDDMDTYSCNHLYNVARYNFPLLYEYWNYRTQDYYDPAGKMTRDQVVDYIFANGEPETTLLSVRAFSQRYMVTDEKYASGDYNMENLWQSSGLMDNERTIRVMKPMTEAELRNATPTASDTRYWVSNIRLDMKEKPNITSQGKVAAPTAAMTEDTDNYYITFDCATPGATILYNHNYISPSYTPTSAYIGGTVAVPKGSFPDGTVTMTCHAVKDGWTDAGVTTLTLKSFGTGFKWHNPYTDVATGSWYYRCVEYVTQKGLFDATGSGKFSPDAPMTRATLATALWRMAGMPKSGGILKTPFTDISASADYADAVAWCYENGVVNGTTTTTFSPAGGITREQITAMFCRYAENVAKADMTEVNDLAAYTDRESLSSWALNDMKWAVGAGLISGTTATMLTPQGIASRAQVASMVMRLADYIEKE